MGTSREVHGTHHVIAPGPDRRQREGLHRLLRSSSVHGTGQEHLRSRGVCPDRKSIAVLAHRLRATQSPPAHADVRRRMDQLGEGFLHAMHDPAPYGADAESAQVRSTSGEPRSRYPELHDGWKAPEGSLRFGLLYIIILIGQEVGRVEVDARTRPTLPTGVCPGSDRVRGGPGGSSSS